MTSLVKRLERSIDYAQYITRSQILDAHLGNSWRDRWPNIVNASLLVRLTRKLRKAQESGDALKLLHVLNHAACRPV